MRTLGWRIRGRGRVIECDISYWRRLDRPYENWLAQCDLSPVLAPEPDGIGWMTDLADRVGLFRRIESFL